MTGLEKPKEGKNMRSDSEEERGWDNQIRKGKEGCSERNKRRVATEEDKNWRKKKRERDNGR